MTLVRDHQGVREKDRVSGSGVAAENQDGTAPRRLTRLDVDIEA
jgi:hypothetical protein